MSRSLFCLFLLVVMLLCPLVLTQAAPPSPPESGVTVVEIRNDGFHPQNVTIKSGGTVKWVNKDTKTHSLTFVSTTSAPNSETAPIPPGSFVEVAFKEGTHAYFATDHPSWKGTVKAQR